MNWGSIWCFITHLFKHGYIFVAENWTLSRNFCGIQTGIKSFILSFSPNIISDVKLSWSFHHMRMGWNNPLPSLWCWDPTHSSRCRSEHHSILVFTQHKTQLYLNTTTANQRVDKHMNFTLLWCELWSCDLCTSLFNLRFSGRGASRFDVFLMSYLIGRLATYWEIEKMRREI